MAAQLQPTDQRLIDYKWYGTELNGPVWWNSTNRFCGDCAECDCPVLIAIQDAKCAKLRMDAQTTATQNACPYVAEYREADGLVPVRQRRAS